MKALMTGLVVLAALIAHAESTLASATKTTTANATHARSPAPLATYASERSPKEQEQDKKEKELIAIVKTQYKKFGKNVSGVKPNCYGFGADVEKSIVNQTEVHNKTCGGDPRKITFIARYEVKDGNVLIEDPVSGKMIPFDKNFRSDGP